MAIQAVDLQVCASNYQTAFAHLEGDLLRRVATNALVPLQNEGVAAKKRVLVGGKGYNFVPTNFVDTMRKRITQTPSI